MGLKTKRHVCGNNVPEQAIGSGAPMKLEVECYSGFKADERPVRFRLDGRPYLVEELLDQWYGPQDVFYKLRADDGNLYILRHETSTPEGNWHLVSFRQVPPEH
jgi:hypothetical protein